MGRKQEGTQDEKVGKGGIMRGDGKLNHETRPDSEPTRLERLKERDDPNDLTMSHAATSSHGRG